MNQTHEPTTAKPGEINSFSVLGARLTWVIAGPLALVAITIGIIRTGSGWLTGLDLAFAIAIGLMLLGRWFEQRSGSATTLTGEPTTFEQYKHYMVALVPVAAAIWIIANVVGNHVLS